jgi:hypothetical protein
VLPRSVVRRAAFARHGGVAIPRIVWGNSLLTGLDMGRACPLIFTTPITFTASRALNSLVNSTSKPCAIVRSLRYWMISSARPSTAGGIVMPRAFAVLRLITSWNWFGCKTGSSAGVAPLRMRPIYRPSCRKMSA